MALICPSCELISTDAATRCECGRELDERNRYSQPAGFWYSIQRLFYWICSAGRIWFYGLKEIESDSKKETHAKPATGAVSVIQLKTIRKRGVDTQSIKVVMSFQPPLKHHKIYVFSISESGVEFGKCKAARIRGLLCFQMPWTRTGKKVRVCLRCLGKYGSREQVDLAAKRSKYARRVVECWDALSKLEQLFPDENRRPYGTKSLKLELEKPLYGFQGIERVIHKIKYEAWTAHDEWKSSGGDEAQSPDNPLP